MKKLLALTLSFMMLACLFACNSDEQTEPNAILESAQQLIDEGKYKEAYVLLYENKGDDAVKEMLEHFVVKPAEEKIKYYDIYNYITETEYNEYGDEISIIGQYDYTYKYKYDYTYNSNGTIRIKKEYLDGGDEPYEITQYTYDDNSNLVEKLINSCTSNDTKKYLYEYNSNNDIVKETYTFVSNAEVISRYVYTYSYNDNNVLAKKVTEDYVREETKEEFYNEDGNVIKAVETDSQDNVDTYEYTYNENGDIIKEIYTYLPFNEEPIESVTEYDYKYDEKGNITEYTENKKSGIDTYKYEYNEQGDVIKETIDINSYTSITQEIITEYTYGENGNILKKRASKSAWVETDVLHTVYDKYGNPLSATSETNTDTYEYEYNEKGQMLSKTDKDGNKTEYSYDKDGNQIKIHINNTDTDYTYNSYGDMLSYCKRVDGKTVEEKAYEYKYNSDGNMTEMIVKKLNNTTERYEYLYDKNGNVIERLCYDNNNKYYLSVLYERDEKGNIIESKMKYPDKEETETTAIYTYDEYGNVLTEMSKAYANAKPVMTEYSDYQYFYIA